MTLVHAYKPFLNIAKAMAFVVVHLPNCYRLGWQLILS